MKKTLQIFPYISTPNGINVCFSINGGPVEQRHFPAGTKSEEIVAILMGDTPPAKPDPEAEARRKSEEERKARAAESQAPDTMTEEELKANDTEREKAILDLNAMRAKLKEANVKGYQLLKGDGIRKKYNEMVEKGVIKED